MQKQFPFFICLSGLKRKGHRRQTRIFTGWLASTSYCSTVVVHTKILFEGMRSSILSSRIEGRFRTWASSVNLPETTEERALRTLAMINVDSFEGDPNPGKRVRVRVHPGKKVVQHETQEPASPVQTCDVYNIEYSWIFRGIYIHFILNLLMRRITKQQPYWHI